MTITVTDTTSATAAEPCECALCGETFENERALRRHVRSIGLVN